MHKKQYYNPHIRNASQYLISKQNKEGYWESRWYYGAYYGTYVCMRILLVLNEYASVSRALKYIIATQNTDGGFSEGTQSDPLSTALAVLCIKLCERIENEHDLATVLKKASSYLLNRQKMDGSWDAIDFIRPKVYEPYKSKTLTTAYVLKALS